MNFALEGAQHFSYGKGNFLEENLFWNFEKGTTAKAQGITAIAVGPVGCFKAWNVYD